MKRYDTNVFEVGIADQAVKWPAERRGQVLTKLTETKIQNFVNRCKSRAQRVKLLSFFQTQMSEQSVPDNVEPHLLLDVGFRVKVPFPLKDGGSKVHDIKLTIPWPVTKEVFIKAIVADQVDFLSSTHFHNDEFAEIDDDVRRLDETLDLLHEFGNVRRYLDDRLEQDLRLVIRTENQRLIHEAWSILESSEFKDQATTVIRNALRDVICEMTKIVRPAVDPNTLHELVDEAYIKDIMDE